MPYMPNGNILVYDENWEYQRTITPASNPAFSININGSIYIALDNIIQKYDKYLNVTKQVNVSGFNRGIYYNPSNQLVYVANGNNINVYDKDLIYNYTLPVPYTAWFITGYNGQMVVTDYSNGKIYFYQGNSLNKPISTQCSGFITTVLFDDYNQMLVLCNSPSKVFIYNLNGQDMGITLPTCSSPYSMNFDSKNRLVILCATEIDIYY